jgi:hypothetical protein
VKSLHVPATTVQRVVAVVRWLAPYALAGVVAAIGFGWRWFESRTSREDVAALITTATSSAAAAQATAHSAASLAKTHTVELVEVWKHVVAMRAELKVLRAYGRADGPTRSRYIDEAQAFYAREYEIQLASNRNNPAEAVRLALLAVWRPDR